MSQNKQGMKNDQKQAKKTGQHEERKAPLAPHDKKSQRSDDAQDTKRDVTK